MHVLNGSDPQQFTPDVQQSSQISIYKSVCAMYMYLQQSTPCIYVYRYIHKQEKWIYCPFDWESINRLCT